MELKHFDSLNCGGAMYLALSKEFLEDKFPVVKTDSTTRTTIVWKLVGGSACSSFCLAQNNADDCGVYMLHMIVEIWRYYDKLRFKTFDANNFHEYLLVNYILCTDVKEIVQFNRFND